MESNGSGLPVKGDEKKVKWYHKPVAIVVAIIAVGPFALPMIWGSPALTRTMKIVLTVVILALTIMLIKVSIETYQAVLKEVEALNAALR